MHREKTWLYYLFQPYKWLIYAPLLAISMVVCAVVILISCRWFPRFCNRRVAPGWCVFNTYTAFSSMEISGRENIDPEQSYIIVANHLSHFDIFPLYGWLGMDLRWVMKQELRSIPFFGAAAEALGHIYVDRSDRERAREQLESARQSFSPGSSIMFFPEGTRGERGKLKPFKNGAFVMARQMELPVLPVAISGTDAILPPRSTDLYPGRGCLQILPPISSDDVQALTVEGLNQKARQQIEASLGINPASQA